MFHTKKQIVYRTCLARSVNGKTPPDDMQEDGLAFLLFAEESQPLTVSIIILEPLESPCLYKEVSLRSCNKLAC